MRVQSLLVPTALAALASAQYYETYFEGDIAAREAYPEQTYDELDILAARDLEELQAREAEAEAAPFFYDEEDFANALIARDPEAFDALVELYARDALAEAEAEALAEAKEEKEKKKHHGKHRKHKHKKHGHKKHKKHGHKKHKKHHKRE